MKNNNKQLAIEFTQAIKTIAEREKNLDNFENYLSYHFDKWLEKWANTPENITAELKAFANMII